LVVLFRPGDPRKDSRFHLGWGCGSGDAAATWGGDVSFGGGRSSSPESSDDDDSSEVSELLSLEGSQ